MCIAIYFIKYCIFFDHAKIIYSQYGLVALDLRYILAEYLDYEWMDSIRCCMLMACDKILVGLTNYN